MVQISPRLLSARTDRHARQRTLARILRDGEAALRLLGSIHGGVRARDQLVGAESALGDHLTDAGADRDLLADERERPGQSLLDMLGEAPRRGRLIRVLAQQQEL